MTDKPLVYIVHIVIIKFDDQNNKPGLIRLITGFVDKIDKPLFYILHIVIIGFDGQTDKLGLLLRLINGFSIL